MASATHPLSVPPSVRHPSARLLERGHRRPGWTAVWLRSSSRSPRSTRSPTTHRPTLLSNAGFGDSAALPVNGVNVAMTIVVILLLDRVGRRPLLPTGTTGMTVGMAIVAFTFLIGGSDLHGAAAYVAIAGLLVCTGSFAMWSRSGALAADQRDLLGQDPGEAMSVATIANWGANSVVAVSLLTLMSAIGYAGTFFFVRLRDLGRAGRLLQAGARDEEPPLCPRSNATWPCRTRGEERDESLHPPTR